MECCNKDPDNSSNMPHSLVEIYNVSTKTDTVDYFCATLRFSREMRLKALDLILYPYVGQGEFKGHTKG